MSKPDRFLDTSLNPSNRQARKRNTSSTSFLSSTRQSDEESQQEKEPTIVFWWKITVVVSSLTAVLADPLFLYIPHINDRRKCFRMDQKLRILALILRSFTDVIFIIDIVHQIRERKDTMARATLLSSSTISTTKNKKKLKEEKRQFYTSMIIHILALLPLPQISVLVVFFRIRDSKYLRMTEVLNITLLLQYVPYVLRVRKAYKKLHLVEKFVRGVFNFFLYIVASHVLGAFWYYFSIEREISCWLQACKNITGCMVARCRGDSTSTNDAFLDRSCPINPSVATMFDFGMFLKTIQSGYTRETSSPNKFFYYFWVGLKNLSNFGTNLETSSYIWENCFAIVISITGLLLFLYLIGNVQAYMQFSKSREMNEEELSKKMMEKEDAIRQYLTPRNGLPEYLTSQIMANIKHDMLKRKLDSVVDMDLLMSVIPNNIKKTVKRHVGMNAIKNVQLLQAMDVEVLEKICEYLEPVCYPDGHEFTTESTIDSMLFMTEGEIFPVDNHGNHAIVQSQEKPDSNKRKNGIEKLDCFGAELLMWVSPSISCTNLDHPKPVQNVCCHRKVEAFALHAKDLKSVVHDFRQKWNWGMYRCDADSPVLPRSDDMTNEALISSWEQKLIKAQKQKNCREILAWLASTDLGDKDVMRRIEKHIEKTHAEKKEMDVPMDLCNVFPLLSDDIKSTLAMKALRSVDFFKKMPDNMLEPVSKYLEPVIYNENSPISMSEDKLDFMLFVVQGLIVCTNPSMAVATTGNIPKVFFEKGSVYGETILTWASSSSSSVADLPLSTQEFKCQKRVETFSLKALQLKDVASGFGNKWTELSNPPNHENKTYLQIMKEVHKQLIDSTWEKIDNEEFKHQMKFMCKEKEILDWLLKHNFREDLITEVMKIIKENKVVEKNGDRPVDVEYLFSVDLPWTIEKDLRDHLCMRTLKKVPLLQLMPLTILESMCNNLKPVVYQNDELIVGKGKALDLVLIIIEGEIILADNDFVSNQAGGLRKKSLIPKRLGKGKYFGEKLFNWFSVENKLAGSAPVSPHNFLCQTKVEAFVLTINKLRSVVSDNNSEWISNFKSRKKKDEPLCKTKSNEIADEKSEQQEKIMIKEKEIDEWVSRNGFDEDLKKKFRFHVKINNAIEENIDAEVDVEYIFSLKLPWVDIAKPITEHLCIDTLKAVPMLKKMPEEVLKKMCFHMEAVVYKEKDQLVHKGELLDFVFVIVEGVIEWTVVSGDASGSTTFSKKRGDFFGETLLNWASPKVMFSGSAPTSTRDVKCQSKVEAFRLSIKNLKSVISEYGVEWNSNFQIRNAQQQPEVVTNLNNKKD